MQDHLGVAVGLENRTGSHQPLARLVGVDDVAVVADADLAVDTVDQDGLRVGQPAFTGRRISRMADGDMSGQRGQCGFVEDVVDVAHLLGDAHPDTVCRGNARAFLSAMLQRVEAQVGHLRRFEVAIDAEDTTFVAKLVEHRSLRRPVTGCPTSLPTSCAQSPWPTPARRPALPDRRQARRPRSIGSDRRPFDPARLRVRPPPAPPPAGSAGAWW